jgi:osmotically-inducible protein OsmY
MSSMLVPNQSADRELEKRVANYLHGRHVPSLRKLGVQSENGAVTLSGRVHSFHEKQIAIHCCRRVAGVVQLIDDVDVALPLAVSH